LFLPRPNFYESLSSVILCDYVNFNCFVFSYYFAYHLCS
jgi:hypothetical protein